MSTQLLQDVLRPRDIEHLTGKLNRASLHATSPSPENDSDDELVGVTSSPGTPARSRTPSRTPSRAPSPTRSGASKRPAPGPLLLPKKNGSDPLKALTTDICQVIFGLLTNRDLAKCALVCKKWSRSQTINYVWFQRYRQDNYHDDSLTPGKWTRRESKQSWRQVFFQSASQRDKDLARTPFSGTSSPSRSGYHSGYQTPREIKEEQWRLEAENVTKPDKVEMRSLYKELGGRKAKSKGKLGGGNSRDRGGWNDPNDADGW